MEGAGLQLVLEVADNGKCAAKVKCLVAALAARRVQDDRDVPGAPNRFHFANELIAGHVSLSDENVRMSSHSRVRFAALKGERCSVRSWPPAAVGTLPLGHLQTEHSLQCAPASLNANLNDSAAARSRPMSAVPANRS